MQIKSSYNDLSLRQVALFDDLCFKVLRDEKEEK